MTETEIRDGYAAGTLTDCDECGATIYSGKDCPRCEEANEQPKVVQQPRVKATYRGQVLGWYDTAEEGEAAIDAARREDRVINQG